MNKKNVFISYGHGIFDEAVAALAADLREFGFNVFLDVDYLKMGDWEAKIDEAILSSDFFLFLVSARSISKDGYCLNELCRAGEQSIEIIPIKLDESTVPLSINKQQRLSLIPAIAPDGTLIDSAYRPFLMKLIEILSGQAQLGFSDVESVLWAKLKPVSSKELTYRYFSSFCGRHDAFAAVESFLKSNRNIFWLNARPGAGKTAFSAMLTWRYVDIIGAVHFCKFNNSDRVNPKLMVTSIAYQLSEHIPEYRDKLIALPELDTVFEKNVTRIFEYLIIEPLCDIDPGHPVAVVVDAIDECSMRGASEFCSVFQRTRELFPSWLKFILTSRNEADIRRVLYPISQTYTLTDENTKEDLSEYYRTRFPEADESAIRLLLEKSEGSFLYASEIAKKIEEEHLSFDRIEGLPLGIYGFFNDCFSRIFDSDDERSLDYGKVKPLLEFLCVAKEPTSIEFLEEFLGWDEYELKAILARINGLFPLVDDTIEPLHKSLIDWLTNNDIGQIYYISKKNGNKRLAAYLERIYAADRFLNNRFVLKYFGSVLIELKDYARLSEILNDYALQKNRIDFFEFDSGLGNYLEELEELNKNARDLCLAVLSGDTFIRIFSGNRRLLYNSGKFFDLKRMGLSIVLARGTGDWGLEGEIGKVFYYYIVEDFEKAIKKADGLLQSREELRDNYSLLSEIYNVKGLSERKLVRFDNALDSFEKSIEYAELAKDGEVSADSDAEFELSLAHLIKGKIYLSMLRFDESNRSCKKAIKVLSRKIDEMPPGDKRTSNTLFLAEDHRVTAYGYIWQGDFEAAEEHLASCDEIYEENSNTVDRYYVRYQYTSLFLQIMKRETVGVAEALRLLAGTVTGSYDKGQINFLLALDIFLNHGEDKTLLADGLSYARAGADIYDSIDAFLEKAECELLARYLASRLEKRISTDGDDNEFVMAWIDYLDSVLTGKKGAKND